MLRRLLQITLGIVLGLAVAELVFWMRDDGAFPHLNLYRADQELGVRLRPGTSERIRFGGNPLSEAHVNASGYRGADWPAAPDNAIAVVGDSQVFGLGVNDTETFSAQLAQKTGRVVLNAGVPTYGPGEMLAVTRELVAAQKPRVVVFTINMANDLFEAKPNRERHAVWDGWAVRIESAPASVVPFPFRDLIMRRSHLVYAARRWLHTTTDAPLGTLPSEGLWDELERATQQPLAAKTRDDIIRQADQNRYEPVYQSQELEGFLVEWATKQGEKRADIERALIAARGNPGDIVSRAVPMEAEGPGQFRAFALFHAGERLYQENGEEEVVTTETIQKALTYRKTLEQRVQASPNAKALAQVREEVAKAMTEIGALRRQSLATPRPASPLRSAIADLAAACAPPQCSPVVVVLPLDLQVAPAEWTKYGLERHDLSKVGKITETILADARSFGMRTVDALEPLTAAEPGAFLDGDLHMTPKGHSAVADAIAKVLAEPAPLVSTSGALPEGRSRVPTHFDFRAGAEATVRGSTKANCRTVLVDEWLRVQCFGDDVRKITMVTGTRDVFVNQHKGGMTLVVPLVPGEPAIAADFAWANRVQRLTASRDANGVLSAAFEPPSAKATPPLSADAAAKILCDCYLEREDGKDCGPAYGSAQPYCFDGFTKATWESCRKLMDCAQGFTGAAPQCPPGSAVAGGTQQCFPICNVETPCATGTCVAWPDTHVCMGGT